MCHFDEGVVVPFGAMESRLRECGRWSTYQNAIAAVDAATRAGSPPDIERACDGVRDVVTDAGCSLELAATICAGFFESQLGTGLLAVRASANVDDPAQMSGCGGHVSVVGVQANSCAAVAEAMEREQRKAAAMMEAMVEADGAASAAHDAATIGALREELRAVRAAAGDAEATWAGRLEEAAEEEEELRRRLIRAEERATAAEAEAAEARAGEDDNGAEAEELRDALNRARGEIEARDAEIEKNQKELVRLRHHLLELEEEDDAKAEEAELNAEALVREREEEHAATVNDLTARLAAAERELEVTRRAVDAKDRELANLQVAMDIFNTDEEARGRLSLEAQALREKNAHLAAELVVAKEQVTAANARASGAECDARAEKERADAAAAETQRAIGEAGKARQALQQSMQQAKHLMDSSTELLDKRIVSKLLLTYFEREQSPDVLELMARMLNMSEDEKSKMGLGERAAAKPGLIRSVATAPVRVAFGALGFAGTVAKTALQSPVHVARALTPEEEKQTVADQWVEFLLSQMDAADEDEIAGKKFKVQPIAAPATPGP